MKENITNKSFYENNEDLYNFLSDYVNNETLDVPIESVMGHNYDRMSVELNDCYIENGDFYTPSYYKETYRGNGDVDDQSTYEPVYDKPTLTKEQVEVLLKEYLK